jgi:hypothetical protein
MIIVNLVTPKAAAKQELLFNKPASGDKKKSLNFWNKCQSSCKDKKVIKYLHQS